MVILDFSNVYKKLKKEEAIPVDNQYIKQWIRACLAQGGTPLFKTRFFGYSKPGYLTAICYGGLGEEISERWKVPITIWHIIKEGKEDLKNVLKIVDPDYLDELNKKFIEEYKKLLKEKERLGIIKIIEE